MVKGLFPISKDSVELLCQESSNTKVEFMYDSNRVPPSVKTDPLKVPLIEGHPEVDNGNCSKEGLGGTKKPPMPMYRLSDIPLMKPAATGMKSTDLAAMAMTMDPPTGPPNAPMASCVNTKTDEPVMEGNVATMVMTSPKSTAESKTQKIQILDAQNRSTGSACT